MSPSVMFRINLQDVAAQTIDDESVIINFATGIYHTTDAVGAAIWTWLETGMIEAALRDALRQRYHGDPGEMARAVTAFLDVLMTEGLVIHDVTPPTPATPPAYAGVRMPFTAPVLRTFTDMAEALLLDPVHEIEDRGSRGAG